MYIYIFKSKFGKYIVNKKVNKIIFSFILIVDFLEFFWKGFGVCLGLFKVCLLGY